MVKDVFIDIDSLVYPIFIVEGEDIREEISSMPNQFRYSIDRLSEELDELKGLGIKSILLFGIPKNKDIYASEAYNEKGIIQEATRFIKKNYPDFIIITDLCMCEYTSHGHCGILKGETVDNDETLKYLGKIAISQARAGADIIAPSDMMDGRIAFIRNLLDKEGFKDIIIMSYAIKYSSAFYGPFRDAADSCPSFGDRKSYQMDFRRKGDAYIEAIEDIKEGADIIMVKPALAYLDIIKDISDKVNVPVAAYNVSGEYSMLKAAAEKGWIDEKETVLEKIYAIKRAGANIIITYYAKDVAKWLKDL